MKLDELYGQVMQAIAALDFEQIWPGFAPLKFALYDEKACFYDGAYIEKTDAFCANTSIVYRGEQIAIWKATDALPVAVLVSKIVHEMFHGYQLCQGWDCWADEMEALYRYTYSAGNLGLKLHENALLLSLLDRFDRAACMELLSCRKLRSEKYPYEHAYESRVEEIEGTATYVEWRTLKQLDKQAAAAMEERMRAAMTKPEKMFPIRISSYYTGALTVYMLVNMGLYSYTPTERPVIDKVLKNICPSDAAVSDGEGDMQRAADAVTDFHQKAEAVIEAARKRNEIVVNGPAALACVNIYDAWCYKGYMTSRHFLQYVENGTKKTIDGSFVLKMADEKTIARVYRWEDT